MIPNYARYYQKSSYTGTSGKLIRRISTSDTTSKTGKIAGNYIASISKHCFTKFEIKNLSGNEHRRSNMNPSVLYGEWSTESHIHIYMPD